MCDIMDYTGSIIFLIFLHILTPIFVLSLHLGLNNPLLFCNRRRKTHSVSEKVYSSISCILYGFMSPLLLLNNYFITFEKLKYFSRSNHCCWVSRSLSGTQITNWWISENWIRIWIILPNFNNIYFIWVGRPAWPWHSWAWGLGSGSCSCIRARPCCGPGPCSGCCGGAGPGPAGGSSSGPTGRTRPAGRWPPCRQPGQPAPAPSHACSNKGNWQSANI